MYFKTITGFVALMLLVAFGCQKTELDQTPDFVRKVFTPKDENDAKTRVKSFLNAVETKQKGAAERTTFQDLEVNEGLWTMEGAANYEKYMNLGSGTDGEVIEYTFSVDNITINGELKMVGTDMTTEYALLLSLVASEESTSNKLASAIDMDINSSNASSTSITAKVLYEAQTAENSDEWITFPTAAKRVTRRMNNVLGYDPNTQPWFPDLTIVLDPVLLGPCLLPLGPCMTYGAGDIELKDYHVNWLNEDRDLALAIGNYFFTTYQPPVGFPILESIRRIDVSYEYIPVIDPIPYIDDAKWL